VYHSGDQGDEQRGVDLIAEMADGAIWAQQCKRNQSFTPAQARKAISAATYPAQRYTLLLSCVASSKVRDVFGEREDWDLWDARDIAVEVRALPIEVAARLVEEHFGPGWRAAFLGLEPASPFAVPGTFFAPFLESGRLFRHDWALVGREETLRALDDFVGADKGALLLPGRGGIGKSKLLHTFAADFAGRHPGVVLRFLQPGTTVVSEVLDYLPAGPTLLVIDDAHQREDLEQVLTLLHGIPRSAPLQVLLATRPHALDRLRGTLARAGYDARAIEALTPLRQLDRSDTKRLALQVLGTADQAFMERFATMTGDSRLVTVVGGQLLAQRQIPVALLERDADFRAAVLDRFSEVLLGAVHEQIPRDRCRQLLEIIAALAPLRPAEQEFQVLVAAVLGIDAVTLARHLGTLEVAGVLLRRGTSIRITPDVLADHLLHRACLTEAGEATGFAQQLFERFGEQYPACLLANLAELDWRQRGADGEGPKLLADIWGKLEAAFDAASYRERCRFLETLVQRGVDSPVVSW